MRVSTSKLTYVVFHMSLLQVAWGLTLVAQVCQKTFKITSSEFTYMCFYMPLLQSCLGGTPFGARSSGPEVRGPKFGARLLWHRYAKKTFDYIIIVHIHVLLRAFATKLTGGTLFGARSSGPEVRGPTLVAQVRQKTFDYIIRVHKFICASTCLCYNVAWGSPHSGPEVRGPTLVV